MQAEAARLIDHALALIAQTEVGTERVAARAAHQLANWRAESAEHERAYQEATHRWEQIGSVAHSLRAQFAEPAARPQRRQLLGFALAAAAAASGWRLLNEDTQPRFAKNYSTGQAQLLKVALQDGSQIELNARSELSVAYYRKRRTVRLTRGEARFDVAHQPEMPFIVTTLSGTVEVIGTVFSVAQRDGLMTVNVERGQVRVRKHIEREKLQTADIDLHAGEALNLREGEVGAVHRIEVRDAAAWRHGWLVFDNTRLDEALPAINAFLASPLQLDANASGLRLTGRFRANDPNNLLMALPAALPVTVAAQADGVVRISARASVR
ncbi:MAG: iron dicitrate transport regulator FecR [Comamonadaceae bacterium]|nr:MAG: iron dicitrate transport regulator FecR [Comamonadaceae bacterium]